MAWIEVHQSLREHRKTFDCADLLSISRVTMVGTLVSIWLWALDNAQDGCLSNVSARTLARICDFPEKKADKLLAALVETGWLDRDGENLVIHDWEEYAGKLMERREKDRERKRKKGQPAPRSSEGNPPETPRNSCATVPNPTVPNPTVPITQRDSGEDGTPGSAAEGMGAPVGKASVGFDGQSFSRFWETYPERCKRNRETAYAAWRAIAPNRETAEIILNALEKWKKSRRWLQDNGDYIPNPENFLRNQYWKNPPPPGKQDAPCGGRRELGPEELEAIARILAEPIEEVDLSAYECD